ncbi:MAG: PDZ domain-containing protein, partial [Planctomycetes bacterium]|nr:PDZ domain-containing protein [Planctomycetota bacterium]
MLFFSTSTTATTAKAEASMRCRPSSKAAWRALAQRLAIFAALLSVAVIARAEETARTPLVVMELRGKDITAEEVAAVTHALAQQLAAKGPFEVAARERVWAECLLRGVPPGRQDADAALRIAGAMGAKRLVTGSLARFNEVLALRVRVRDVQDGRMQQEVTCLGREGVGPLLAAMGHVVERLVGRPTPPPQPEEPKPQTAEEWIVKGRAYEDKKQWALAALAYEQAKELSPLPTDIEPRLDLCRTHAHIAKRYASADFRNSVERMTPKEGLGILEEALTTIENNYVEEVKLGRVFARSLVNLQVLLDVPELGKFYPKLLEDTARRTFAEAVEQAQQDAEASPSATPSQVTDKMSRVLSSSQASVQVPDGLLVAESVFGLTRGLDPRSLFLTTDMLRELEVTTSGTFSGIGAEIQLRHGVLNVTTPLEGSPALKAGIRPNDAIIRVDKKWTLDMEELSAIQSLRGPRGTPVKVMLYHPGDDLPTEITLTRDEIAIHTVKQAKMLDEALKIGYIRLSAFQQRSAADLEQALAALEEQGLKALVLDLRGNPGGLLDSAVAISDKFVGGGRIVSMKGRIGSANREFDGKTDGTHPDYPLAILVDRTTASASEIVAAAVRDHGRGVVIGTRTQGKGSVQGMFRLRSGKAAFNLTVARYFPPSGVNFDGVGVMPDLFVELSREAQIALARRQRAEWAAANVGQTDTPLAAIEDE